VIELLANVLVLMLALTLVLSVCYGWGKITFVLLGIGGRSTFVTVTAWIGFCSILFATQSIHFFVAIDWRVSLGVGALGLARILLFDRADVSRILSHLVTTTKLHPWFATSCAAALCILCLWAMQSPTMYDSGLYHFASIRWVNEQPLVPGLGNLHWRLALNQSYFGFLALLNIFPFWGKGYALGGLFLLALGIFTLLELPSAISPRFRMMIFALIVMPYLFLFALAVANPSPDLAVGVLQVAIFGYMLSALLTRDLHLSYEPHILITILFLCVAIGTIKLSSVGFALACFVLTLGLLWKTQELFSSTLIKTFVVLALVMVFHILKGYLLSGAPLFPSPVGGIWSLPWAVAPGVAEFESRLIYAWARSPGIASPELLPTGFGWFHAWFKSISTIGFSLFFGSAILGTCSLIFRYRQKLPNRLANIDLLYVPLVIGLVFWFVTAPDPRFLGATVILLFAFTVWRLVVLFLHSWPASSIVQSRWGGAIFLLLTSFLMLKFGVFDLKVNSQWPVLMRPEVVVERSFKGVEVLVPKTGAQCWDGPLPCAVGTNPDLKIANSPRVQYFDFVFGHRFMYSVKP
jgi:hypothetical protein